MSSHTKVTNLTTNWRIKRSQAISRIEQGLSEWVEENYTIRDLTLAEMVAKRSEQARAEATRHLEPSEVHGIVFRYPESAEWQKNHAEAQKQYRGCLVDAREFASQA